MGSEPPDTSSISFTALYTGHTWVADGLSAPGFRTALGAAAYHALTPLETLGRLTVGDNFRILLRQRHRIIDDRLQEAISGRGVRQVLEIACGLSPRGYRFVQAHPGLTYVEADLPRMATLKERRLSALEGPVPEVVPIHIFATEGALSLEHVLQRFDRSAPLAVITEGLAVYFDLDTIGGFWRDLAHRLSDFPHATYWSETYLLGGRGPSRWLVRGARRALATVARSRVSFHFEDADQARAHFRASGFPEVEVHDPRDFYDRLPIPRSRGAPVVRVIEARQYSDIAS